jgi:hypothetical protein
VSRKGRNIKRVRGQVKLGKTWTSGLVAGSFGLSLDFEVDRVENRIDLGDQGTSPTRNHEGDQVERWRPQESHSSAHVQDRNLTVERMLVR